MPTQAPSPLARAAVAINALAILPTAYVLGAASLVSELSDVGPPSPRVLLFLAATSWSVYLADRVKLRDAWHDPADSSTNPARDAFVWQHRRPLRWLALLLAFVGIVAAFELHPALSLLPFSAQFGVWLYAGAPRGSRVSPRLKDVLFIKNLAAAGSILALTAAALLVPHPDATWLVLLSLAPALLVVAADCETCDIPDAPGDADFGTRTVPVVFGPLAARLSAMVVSMLAGVALLRITGDATRHWSLALLITSPLLAAAPTPWLRTLTDLRLPLLAIIMQLL